MLSDLIMQKIAQNAEGEEGDLFAEEDEDDNGQFPTAGTSLSSKHIQVLRDCGIFLRSYKSGAMPKIFNVIPSLANWEEVMSYTIPGSWSNAANFEATKMFVSNLSSKLVQRFLNL